MATPGYGNVPVEFTKGGGPMFPLGSLVAGSTGGGVAATPTYGADGQPSTSHTVNGQVFATGATASVTFAASVQFSSPGYQLIITNATTDAIVAPSAKTASGFSFPATAGTYYNFTATGP